MNSLTEQLDLYFGKRAPQLPAGLKEGIVKFAPYLVIIGLIFSAIGLLAMIPLMFGASALGVLGAYGIYGSINGLFLALVFSIVTAVIRLMALPGLFKRTSHSWNLLYYSTLLSLLNTILSLNLAGFVISGAIGFYLLFQIRPYYNGTIPTETASPLSPTHI